MINKDNKTTVGVYKGNTEIVKILKNDAVVYLKTSPYPLDNGVYYHKTTGECELTRSSNNNADYDGVIVAKNGVIRGIRLNEYSAAQWGTGVNSKLDNYDYIPLQLTNSNSVIGSGSIYNNEYLKMCGCTATQMWNARNDATGTNIHYVPSWTNPVPNIGEESSQSYIPSRAEFEFLSQELTKVNQYLQNLGGTQLRSVYYQCSGATDNNIDTYNPVSGTGGNVPYNVTPSDYLKPYRAFFLFVPAEGTYYYNRKTCQITIKTPTSPQPEEWGVLISDGSRFVITSAYLTEQAYSSSIEYVYGRVNADLNNIDPFVYDANDMTAQQKKEDAGLKRTMHHFAFCGLTYGFGQQNSYGRDIGNHVHDYCRSVNCYVPSISDLKLLYDYWDEASLKLLNINYSAWRRRIYNSGKLTAVIQSCTVKTEWASWRLSFGDGNAYEGATETNTDMIIPFCYY